MVRIREDIKLDFYLQPGNKPVTGTLIWYYSICRREVWLMAHALTPEEDDPSLNIGRAIHESFYLKSKKEVGFEGMKIDVLQREGDAVICEVKTSSKFLPAARLQLGYYLLRLEMMGVNARGYILIPRERKRISVNLDDELRTELFNAIKDINSLVSLQTPPPPSKIPFCNRCAYRLFCWG